MSFNMRICVKRHHIHNCFFICFICCYWRYYSKYYLKYVISLQIKSSLVPISNHPNRFSINLKRKKLHRDNTLGKVFLLNSVRRLQKLSDLYSDGVRSYKNFASGENRGVWHVSINVDNSNETHQGPPNGTQGYFVAYYRNIVDTKPSHFWSRIRNQIESRIENRKLAERTEPKI